MQQRNIINVCILHFASETLEMTRRTFEKGRSRTQVFEKHAKFRTDRKSEAVEEQSQMHAQIFFDIKGTLHKDSSWQAKQSIPHTTVTFSATS
jgi:hypothetical protein